MQIRRTAAALTSAAALSVTGVAMATPASAALVNNQAGLVAVNVQLDDVTIQVPVAAAVALCDTNVNILSLQIVGENDRTTCEALADSRARN